MTTTNNSAKYAVSLDYEVREADNSINCKTAYEVFDNMQDAVNYAIDFIANNPDANIRLTNEHFNGSQIKAYGNGSTKYYDLTDADINAVRNVEVNEADVEDYEAARKAYEAEIAAIEDYAVTAEAQDIAVNAEVNAVNAPVNPERFRAVVYYYRPDENGGTPWHGSKDVHFPTAKDAADFIIQFAAEHPDYTILTDSNIRDWDTRKQYPLSEADIHAIKTVNRREEISAEMSALAVEIADARLELMDAEAEPDDPDFDESTCTPQSHIDYLNDHINTLRTRYDELWCELADLDRTPPSPDDFEQKLDIIEQRRREQGNFTEKIGDATVTFCNWHIVKIREHIWEYQIANGKRQFRICGRLVSRKEFADSILQNADDFEREYAQAADATERIRQIDPGAEIIFAVDEDPDDRFILTTSDNSIALCATAAEAENYFHTLQADKITPHVTHDDFNEHINHTLDGRVECRRHFDREEMWLTNGRWFHILSDKYDADIFRHDDGSIAYGVTFDGDFISQNVPEDEFFAVMARRGACSIDPPEPADIINNLNAHAPEGWSVIPDHDNKKFFVKHAGQSVAELDSLALAKSLPPDKFFDRFTLTDEPNQHYADQLSRERQALIDMRDELSDPARIKIIDGLIKDIEREILTARLDLPTSAC